MEVRVEGYQLQSWHREAKECLLTKITSPFTLELSFAKAVAISLWRTSLVRAQNSEQPKMTPHGKA